MADITDKMLPVAAYLKDYTTGAPIDPNAPAPVTSLGVAVTGSPFSLPAAGFANPMYLAANVNDPTGWSVANVSETLVTFEGTYTGLTGIFEFTNDETGNGTWYTQAYYNPTLSTGSQAAGSTSGTAVLTGGASVLAARGMRQRFKATALSTGTVVARVSTRSMSPPANMVSAEAHGAVPHASAIGAAPVRVGGRARAVGAPYSALSADQVADLVTDLAGNLKTTQEYSKTNITSATTTQVLSGVGVLHTVTINKGVAASTVSIYDATSGTTNPIAVIDSALSNCFVFDCAIATGIRVITSGATDVTVNWR